MNGKIRKKYLDSTYLRTQCSSIHYLTVVKVKGSKQNKNCVFGCCALPSKKNKEIQRNERRGEKSL
jgi:hypothetical protein